MISKIILEKGMIHQIMMNKQMKDNYQVNGVMNDEMAECNANNFLQLGKKCMLWKYK